ncbi:MAG: oligopeptidase A [Kangiella sp.]|nr:MAG: oligopeptidase A [Kangiella sp.]
MTIINPLLLNNPIEQVANIKPEHVAEAIEQVIDINKEALKRLKEKLSGSQGFNWDEFMYPLEVMEDKLGKVWSPVSHLNSVCNSDELRTAYDQALALLTDYSTEQGQDKELFKLTETLYKSRDKLNLSATKIHILKDSLIGFKLSGLDLNEEDKKQYAKIQSRLAELSSKYEQNLMDATMAWNKHFDNADSLAGLPETEIEMLKGMAKAKEKEGYLVTLEIPSYIAIMTYADDRELREEVYRAYVTRSSEFSEDKNIDNSQVMEELLSLKNKKAKLLGFAHYAELSLESKMATDTEEVLGFLYDLAKSSKEQAKQEFKALKDFASENGITDFKAWDSAYYSEKLMQKEYQISQSQLRPYFPIDKVILGLFDLTKHHFNVEIKEKIETNVWHKDVKHYQIFRTENNQQNLIAEFYLDPYARTHKRGGAWMDDYQGRFKLVDQDSEQNTIQIPIAFLTCNFTPASEGKPGLITHDEVVTLFHEFGHGIHHMLTQVNELSASGISNVPWDAVELPSQFMENFCYQAEVIEKISSHHETGESLPTDLLNKLIKAKNFQSAMMMVRQLEFSIFDIKIHKSDGLSVEQVQKVLDETRSEVSVSTPPSFNRFQNGFSHIFAGGYSAGYYSYKWAEVLSSDAFSLFEEMGVMNPDAGKKFLNEILEKGGSAEPMALFEKFRGRKPNVDALLRHSGIAV